MARTKPGAHRAAYEQKKAMKALHDERNAPLVPSFSAAQALKDSNPHMRIEDIKPSVQMYLNAVYRARKNRFAPKMPSEATFLYIVSNWRLFNGDPKQRGATKYDLGDDWFETANKAWSEGVRHNMQLKALHNDTNGEVARDHRTLDAAQTLAAISTLQPAQMSMRNKQLVKYGFKPIERMVIVARPIVTRSNTNEGVGAPTRKRGRPASMAAEAPVRQSRRLRTDATSSIPMTTNTPSTTGMEKRATKRKQSVAFGDLEEDDRFQAGEGAESRRKSSGEDENAMPGSAQNKRRRTSGDSVVGASTRLTRSPKKKTNLLRLSGLGNKDNGVNHAPDKESVLAPPGEFKVNGNKSLEKNGWPTKVKLNLPWLKDSTHPSTSSTLAETNAGVLEADIDGSTISSGPSMRPTKAPQSRKGKQAASTADTGARAETNARTDAAPSTVAMSEETPEPDVKPVSSNKKYQGKWTMTITGPKENDKKALKSTAPKNTSSRPEDKLWDCEHEPKPLIRSKALKAGVDVDNAEDVKSYLTLRFSLKKDPETKKVIVYDPPVSWDDQQEVTSLIKTINQHRRREAGAKGATRHQYSAQEIDYLAKQFKGNKAMRGATGMSENKKWEDLTASFNEKFRGRTAQVASKGGATVGVGDRSWHAIMALCDRNDAILAARETPKTKITGKRKAGDAELDVEEDEEVVEEKTPPAKKRRAAKVMDQ